MPTSQKSKNLVLEPQWKHTKARGLNFKRKFALLSKVSYRCWLTMSCCLLASMSGSTSVATAQPLNWKISPLFWALPMVERTRPPNAVAVSSLLCGEVRSNKHTSVSVFKSRNSRPFYSNKRQSIFSTVSGTCSKEELTYSLTWRNTDDSLLLKKMCRSKLLF